MQHFHYVVYAGHDALLWVPDELLRRHARAKIFETARKDRSLTLLAIPLVLCSPGGRAQPG